MSHSRTGRRHVLVFSPEGTVELLSQGSTVWASDADPDFTEEFGLDVLEGAEDDAAANDDDAEAEELDEEAEEELVLDVLDYLIDQGYLDQAAADRCLIRWPAEETG